MVSPAARYIVEMMRILRGRRLGLGGLVATCLVIAQLVAAQSRDPRPFSDFASGIGGTWTLKQRTNPDGTPYRSRLQGVMYVSAREKNGDSLGPHAVATIYSKETGIADGHFFNYPAGVVNKPFSMESSSTLLITLVRSASSETQFSLRVSTMTKGDLPPRVNGMVIAAETRFDMSPAAASRGGRVHKIELSSIASIDFKDFAGQGIDPGSLATACCGITSLVITGNTMEIGWSNKGRDIWVRSSPVVPAAFR
jgi:hypothetical protein